MATYNAVIRKRNSADTGWDSILPVTTANNVLTDETGGTVADHTADAGIHVTAEKKAEWDGTTTNLSNLSVTVANMKTNDIEARREIFDIKMKLDEMEVVDYLNKTGIGFFDLFRDTNSINLPYTTALIQAGDVIFSGAKVLQMKQELFSNFTDLELALYDLEREEFEVDVAVNNSKTISMDVTPGTRSTGEKFWYNGQIYTIANVVES